jgi:hypothetical protein
MDLVNPEAARRVQEKGLTSYPEDALMLSMSKPVSISITGDELSVVAGPSYMIQTEDGPGSRYDYFLVYNDRLPDAVTFEENFSSEGAAEKKREEIEEFGGFDTQKWDQGDPWTPYHQGQSMEERYAPYGPAWQAEQEGRYQ